jgi:hypothetical protein
MVSRVTNRNTVGQRQNVPSAWHRSQAAYTLVLLWSPRHALGITAIKGCWARQSKRLSDGWCRLTSRSSRRQGPVILCVI